MSCTRLLLVLAMAGSLSSLAKQPPRQVDLAKLRDPSTANAEALRLLAAREGAEKHNYIIRDLRLHRVEPGNPSNKLAVVVIDYDLDFTNSDWFDGYKIENPDELFATSGFVPVGPDGFHPPRLDVLDMCSVIPIDPNGREVDLPRGLLHVSRGYVYDFDRDGILDIADTGNYGSRNRGTAHVFHVFSVEAEPQLVFQAAYNWDLFPKDPWGFACRDEQGKGTVSITFGPKPRGAEQVTPEVTFRWNAEDRLFQPDPPQGHPRIHLLPKGEIGPLLAKVFEGRLARETGSEKEPAEPDFGGWSEEKPEDPPAAPATLPAFQYHSFKNADDAEIHAFFQGRPREDRIGDMGTSTPDYPENHLPEPFWTLSPKAAALAFADTNRNTRNRRHYQLAVDDRNGIAPPASGWLVHHYRSPSCYSYHTHRFALRFGVDRPFLVHTAHSSSGFVFANPIKDRATHRVRILYLSPEESRFLVDIVFWLNQVRSRGRDDDKRGGSSSSADGWATLTLTEDGSPPTTIADETIWNTSSISSTWTKEYEPATCLNLVEFLLDAAWPRHLGDRWTAAEADPGDTNAMRDQLASFATKAFSIHEHDPLPPGVLLDLVRAIGDEGLNKLMEPIKAIASSLPPLNAEDEEFEKLRIRFAQDHFGNFPLGPPDREGKEWKRYLELCEKRAHQPGPLLRDATTHALRQLASVDRPDLLMDWAQGGDHGADWALQRLEHHYPAAYADVLLGRFEDADKYGKQQIFATLAKRHPKAALQLRDTLGPDELDHLLIDVIDFELKADPERIPDRIPALFAIAESSEQKDVSRRNAAIRLLEKVTLSPDIQARFDALLLAAVHAEPDRGSFPTLRLATAVEILSKRPDAANHWDLLIEAGTRVTGWSDFEAIRDAIIRVAGNEPDKRRQGLTTIVRHRLNQSDGLMNDVFLTALAHDLTELRDDLHAMATTSPNEGDGDGADYSGGRFAGPQGERYHLAREVLAIWAENDPATRAKMWCALVVHRPYRFYHPYRTNLNDEALKARAENAIHLLPPDERRTTIDSMRRLATKYRPLPEDTDRWLQKLAGEGSD